MGSWDWVGPVLQGVGTVLDWQGNEQAQDDAEDYADAQAAELARVAAANAELSYRDAETAMRLGQKKNFEANAKAGLMYNNLQKLSATQRTRYAKSGVNIKEGSPVEVMEETVAAGAKDIMNIKYGGKSAQSEANSLARRYVTLAENGMRDAAAQASLIQDAADDAITAMEWDKWSDFADNMYTWYQTA